MHAWKCSCGGNMGKAGWFKESYRVIRCIACCAPLILLWIWIIDLIIGAIYYDVWVPRFTFQGAQINSFNVTSNVAQELDLNFDLNYSIVATHFSKLQTIETFSYFFVTYYDNNVIGESTIVFHHPNKTTIDNLPLFSAQTVEGYPLEYNMWQALHNNINDNNVQLQVQIQAEVTSPMWWFLKKKSRNQVCDFNFNPPSQSSKSQVLNQTCNTISKVIIAYSWMPQKHKCIKWCLKGGHNFLYRLISPKYSCN